jgi:hypothetical protein
VRFTITVLGFEVLRIDLGPAVDPADDDSHELVATSRHGGEFGFGLSPARPYWSHDPEEAPPVAEEVRRGRG